jgi:hypothetical protein
VRKLSQRSTPPTNVGPTALIVILFAQRNL